MSDLKLINEFINEFDGNRPTSQLIDIINYTKPLGLNYGHIYHSIKASSVIGGFNGRGYWKWAEHYLMNMYSTH